MNKITNVVKKPPVLTPPPGVSPQAAEVGQYLFTLLNKVVNQKKALSKPVKKKVNISSVKKEIQELKTLLDNVQPDRTAGIIEYLASKRNKTNPTATSENRFAGIAERYKAMIKRKTIEDYKRKNK